MHVVGPLQDIYGLVDSFLVEEITSSFNPCICSLDNDIGSILIAGVIFSLS